MARTKTVASIEMVVGFRNSIVNRNSGRLGNSVTGEKVMGQKQEQWLGQKKENGYWAGTEIVAGTETVKDRNSCRVLNSIGT